jgi:hypothetical protein
LLVASFLSLAPGFSRVSVRGVAVSRFNGLIAMGKPLKRFFISRCVNTGLKPGANEISHMRVADFQTCALAGGAR